MQTRKLKTHFLNANLENINQNDTPIDIGNSLDHLTFHPLYFLRTALELSLHAFYISQERTTREK